MARLSSVKIAPADSLAGAPVAGRVVLGCFEKQPLDTAALPRALASAAERCTAGAGWRGREGEIGRERSRGKAASLVEVHGLGRKARCDSRSLAKWLEAVVRQAGSEGESEVAIALPNHPAAAVDTAGQLLLPLLLAGYRFQRFRKRSPSRSPRRVRVVPPAGQEEAWSRALKAATATAHGVALTRDLANTPPNEANPEWMAAQAATLAERFGLAIDILDAEELEKRGMGGILAVGGGSANPPRLVRLEWGEGEESVALVGKGVTFDTGGISIKPSLGMQDMKYDKCGACTVLGVVRAAAELGLEGRFRAYLPLAENMPSGRAYRPGDIVRCYNGKTVEIHNTDAEGRMILADALAWAAEENPGTMLEFSTLTGATVVALGHHGAALYTPDDELASELLAASDASGERIWRMPLWPEFAKEIEGTHADLRNVAGRWGGANTAAAFLSNFTGRVRRWGHLDIAGIAYTSAESGKHGATGRGVALSIEWLRRQLEAARGQLSPAMPPLLSVEELSIAFPTPGGELSVVRGVSFEVPAGAFVGLVGESGSGKSLTALAILRLLPPPGLATGGRVLLDGRDLLTLPAPEMRRVRGRRIGMIFQEPMTALNPVFTVGFQIAEAVRVHRTMSRREAMAEAEGLLDRVAIPAARRRLKDYPHQMSGGQRQRVMIAIALASRPDLLIADEPTTALDVTVQAQILELLDDLRRDLGLAVLLITHDLAVVAETCDRLVVMYAGQVVERASVARLFAAPAHPYTRGLLAAAPRLGHAVKRGELPTIPGQVPVPGRLPAGCAFHPRCGEVMPVCRQTTPELYLASSEPEQVARCFLHGESASAAEAL